MTVEPQRSISSTSSPNISETLVRSADSVTGSKRNDAATLRRMSAASALPFTAQPFLPMSRLVFAPVGTISNTRTVSAIGFPMTFLPTVTEPSFPMRTTSSQETDAMSTC